MKKRVLIFVLLTLVSRAAGQTRWSATKSGCEVQSGAFQDHDSQVPFILLRCDPKRVEIKLVDTATELGKANPYSAFSLREVLNKTHAGIVVNAGSTTSFSLPAPAGLLVIGGRQVSPPHFRVTNSNAVLCIRRSQVTIEELSSTVPKGCLDAVQRGPFLSPGFVSDNKAYRRTAAAVDAQGKLLILVTKKGATLSAVASFFFDPHNEFQIRSALNLDGDVSSGVIFADDEGVKETAVGAADGLVASAIAIRRRR